MSLPKSLTTVTPFSKILAAILFITFPFAGFLAGMQYQKSFSQQASDQSTLFCKHWETICDPNYTDPNGGCAPKKICVDPSPTTLQLVTPTHLPTQNIKPSCIPHVPIGGTGSMPPNYIYPTLPPGDSWCPDSFNEIPPKSWDESVCTQDAKQCPDGSYVGRQGPNCEFKKCPGEN